MIVAWIIVAPFLAVMVAAACGVGRACWRKERDRRQDRAERAAARRFAEVLAANRAAMTICRDHHTATKGYPS